MHMASGFLFIFYANAQISKLRYSQQSPILGARQPQLQQRFSPATQNFQESVSRSLAAERSRVSSAFYSRSVSTIAAQAAAENAVSVPGSNVYGEALESCAYKGKETDACAWVGERPEICGFFLGFSVVPTAKDLCTSVWDFDKTKYKKSLAEGSGIGAYRIMCNALPSDVLDSRWTSEMMNKPVFSKQYGFETEKISINDEVSGRSGRFRQAIETICDTCIEQAPSASGAQVLDAKCAALKRGPAPSASSETKNIFGEQAQDCAPVVLRSQPNYADLRAMNSYECAFTAEKPEICVQSGEGTKCIPFFDIKVDGTRKSILGFAGKLAAGIKIQCDALPSDMLQSQFARDMISQTVQLKPKTSFTGAQYDKFQTAESRKAAAFRDIIETICATCSGEATTESARAVLASNCEAELGATASLIEESSPRSLQITNIGVACLACSLVALIVSRWFRVFQRSDSRLQEHLIRT